MNVSNERQHTGIQDNFQQFFWRSVVEGSQAVAVYKPISVTASYIRCTVSSTFLLAIASNPSQE